MKWCISLLFLGAALGAAPLTQVTLINAGDPAQNDGKHFVGPYTLSLDGQNVPVLCIDFKDATRPGDRWNAHVTQLGLDLGDTYHPAELAEYEEEAYLYTLILEPHADRIDIQHAAWAITDPDYIANAAAERWMAAAQEESRGVKWATFEIISEVPGHACSRKQEFITETLVPEPCLINLISGSLAITLAFYRRRARQETLLR